MTGHECNYYCRPPLHCEVMWVTPGADKDAIWQAVASSERVWVVDVQPAREPRPAPRRGEPGYTQVAGVTEATEPRLVYYRADYKQARAEYEARTLPMWPD